MNLFTRVQELMDWDEPKTILWFTTNNPLLGNVSPDTMILTGRIDRLKKFIDGAERERDQTRREPK